MNKFLYTLVVGLVGAAMVHIVVLLLLPAFSDNTTWSRLAVTSDFYEPVRLDRPVATAVTVGDPDPLFKIVSCRFDLSDGIVRIQADGGAPYWSASIYDRSGANVYSFNDRSAVTGKLDFAVLTPAQTGEVRKNVPEDLQASNLIETDIGEGIAVVRAFAPDETWSPAVNAFLDDLTCQPI